ncbi:MAG: sugar ABC transporter permease [Hyphomicrobiales bacterium]|nr:sugar ABC transporter permease [Hyphomicrobiales bacterium]
MAPSAIVVLAVVVVPVVAGIAASFQDMTLRSLARGTVRFTGFANYRRMLDDPVFWQALGNSIVWVVFNVVAQMIGGLLIALMLERVQRFSGLIRSIILVPWVVPSVVAVLTWRWMYDPNLGIINEMMMRLGVIADYIPWLGLSKTALPAAAIEHVWKGIPFVALMLLAALQMIPQSTIESAKVDGARWWSLLRYIIFPQIRLPFAVCAILVSVYSLNAFNSIWLMTGGGPVYSSEILFTHAYRKGFENFDLGLSAAISTVLFAVLLVASTIYLLLTQRLSDDTEGLK